MNLPEFEKIIRAGLGQQTVDLDTKLFMQKLFEPKKEKRRIIIFWWGIGMLTLAIGSLFLFKPSFAEKLSGNTSATLQSSGTALVPSDSHSSNLFSKSNKNENKSVATDNAGQNTRRQADQTTNTPVTFNPNEYVTFQPSLAKGEELVQLNVTEQEQNQFEAVNIRKIEENPEILNSSLVTPFSKPKFKIKKTVECPSFSVRRKISAFIQPEFGLSLPQKMLQEKIPDVSDVTAYRKENEKSLEGIHAGLLAGCFIGKSSFYVSTGLAYTRITEKLDLSYNYTRRDTTFGIISITKSQSGDTVTVIYGDIVTESTVEGQKIRHHYFHAYDIPLTVGYQWVLSPGWNVNIEAGMLINFRLHTTGQVLKTLQDFTPVAKNEYQSSLGLGYKAGLGIEYLLKPEIGLGVQARVQGYGKTFTSPNSNFQQKYIIPGAHLYLRYYFAL